MAVDELEKSKGILGSYDFNVFYQQLANNEVMDQVHQQFLSMFDHIASKICRNNNSHLDRLAAKVKKAVFERFTDQNLSLESIADELVISPVYLGRQFKKFMGKSVADYINEFRIAVGLMKTTSLSIHEITSQIGFANNYFSTIFKKLYGMTPNEFRQKN